MLLQSNGNIASRSSLNTNAINEMDAALIEKLMAEDLNHMDAEKIQGDLFGNAPGANSNPVNLPEQPPRQHEPLYS